MKQRILECIDTNTGERVFLPQYFNEYKGWKIFKFLEDDADEWASYCHWPSYPLRIPHKFSTLEEAKQFLNNQNSGCKIHELND